ncbi:collagen alpha-2(VIII) chain-like [Mercenaria mercenaria]|uniref:collagen alpha-2(VIII) chain-like n=1 Tax=Mercenaria mercenaria TaxID=6596 RepID=UPI00234E6783|nr:collagen alpha-2(VIII) chain-like [Mercenaria mercenaria]
MFMWITPRNKYYIAWTMLLLIFSSKSKCDYEDLEPGQCVSRFDYDYKVMQKLLQFETKIEAQAREIEELRQRNTCSCTDSQKVAFMAELSKAIINPPTGTIVVFDIVHTNDGDGYKPGPGIFIPPVTGTYNINLVASSGTKLASEYLHLYIMHNTTKVGYIFLDANSDYSLIRSTAIVLELQAGDSVFVKVGNSSPRGRLEGCCFHTLFSGFLIR